METIPERDNGDDPLLEGYIGVVEDTGAILGDERVTGIETDRGGEQKVHRHPPEGAFVLASGRWNFLFAV